MVLAPHFTVQQSAVLTDTFLFQRAKYIKPYVMEEKPTTAEVQKAASGEGGADAYNKSTDQDRQPGTMPAAGFTVTEGIELPPQLKRGGHIGGTIGGKAVVVGGTDWNDTKTVKHWLQNAAVFDRDKWVPGPSLPGPLAYAMYGSDPTGIYVAGGTPDGTVSSRSVYRLHSLAPGAGWELLPPLPEALSYGSGAMLNGKFYVACGTNGREKSNHMWVLDTRSTGTPAWKKCPPVPGPARTLSLLVADGKYLYLLGGLRHEEPLTVLKDAYRYDTGNGTWEQLRDLPLEGYAWAGQPVDAGHLLITGRAYGKIDTGIWLLRLKDMSMEKIGEAVGPATTAPLIKINNKQWWLVGGEPDANKNRTGKVTIITCK